MTGNPPKVFISYSHDTVEHQERVLGLADRLRADGIDAEVDQYNAAPSDGWPLWCERQIAAADVVLMVCTETYHRRVSGDEERGKGLGIVWEARIIRQLLYDAGAVSDKFVPILFSDASPEQIPTPIKGGTRYVIDTEDGYEDLYRRLTGQPRLARPALGTIRPLPTRRRQWSGREAGTMPEPITLAFISGAVLTEGIKFLYDQAAEAIKAWRERRKAGQSFDAAVPASQAPPAIFQGELQPLQYHLGNVQPLKEQLSKLSVMLSGYVSGIEDIDDALKKGDQELLLAVDSLRQAMEGIFEQRLTFNGERRPASGPVVEGKINVRTVEGIAAAVVARLIASGRISAEATADSVKGELYGVKVDMIGGGDH